MTHISDHNIILLPFKIQFLSISSRFWEDVMKNVHAAMTCLKNGKKINFLLVLSDSFDTIIIYLLIMKFVSISFWHPTTGCLPTGYSLFSGYITSSLCNKQSEAQITYSSLIWTKGFQISYSPDGTGKSYVT